MLPWHMIGLYVVNLFLEWIDWQSIKARYAGFGAILGQFASISISSTRPIYIRNTLMLDFDKTFGTKTAAPVRGAASNNAADRPVAQVWMNVGYETSFTNAEGEEETRFISLPLGIAVDTMEPAKVTGSNVGYRQLREAQNDLLAQVMEAASVLAPGESKIVGLQIELRRVAGEIEATPADQNPFTKQLKL